MGDGGRAGGGGYCLLCEQRTNNDGAISRGYIHRGLVAAAGLLPVTLRAWLERAGPSNEFMSQRPQLGDTSRATAHERCNKRRKLVVLDDQAVRVRSGDGPAGRTPL